MHRNQVLRQRWRSVVALVVLLVPVLILIIRSSSSSSGSCSGSDSSSSICSGSLDLEEWRQHATAACADASSYDDIIAAVAEANSLNELQPFEMPDLQLLKRLLLRWSSLWR